MCYAGCVEVCEHIQKYYLQSIIPPLGACGYFGACADHGMGVFMLSPEQKGRADVRPPCEKIYLHRALDGSRVFEAV